MNIFVLSLQIIECAMFHCDQHVIKMILESAQMLCTACVMTGGKAGYKPAHKNHPCTLWVMSSLSNWRWLKSLAIALNDEYKYRYKKEVDHKSINVINELDEPKIEDKGLLPFALAMPDEFRDPDPVLAYRKYYAGAKYRFATWRSRDIPQWYIDLRKEMGGNALKEIHSLLDPDNIKKKRQESIAKGKKKAEEKKSPKPIQKKTQKKKPIISSPEASESSENESLEEDSDEYKVIEKTQVKKLEKEPKSTKEIIMKVQTRKMVLAEKLKNGQMETQKRKLIEQKVPSKRVKNN
ncbi:hypothetical protein SteCoe_22791 [Stentor coeruleus]|uniref:Uncharacterized protein n=1 Tax=Stentor coeruleus TaxID=5963 RepID=A0A1R2BL88_9CILI|nr:hypothetical protein SteCoe_22791 [Stentor coeruleus]